MESCLESLLLCGWKDTFAVDFDGLSSKPFKSCYLTDDIFTAPEQKPDDLSRATGLFPGCHTEREGLNDRVLAFSVSL